MYFFSLLLLDSRLVHYFIECTQTHQFTNFHFNPHLLILDSQLMYCLILLNDAHTDATTLTRKVLHIN